VTGGSAGIGLAIANKCLSEGAIVVITGRSQEKMDVAIKHLKSDSAHALAWDVSRISQRADKFADAVKLAGGPIDILVNNAGILGGYRQFADLSEEVWDELMAVNSKGLVFLTQHVVNEWMKQQQPGKIINMSSMRGILGIQDGPYGMSKWGLNGLTQGLGCKLAPHGIIVNGIAPGIIATDSISIKNVDVSENAYLDYIPVKRIGLSEEIAELAVFLMSDAANYIVGQTIVCDGGYTLRV
jgi:3-oxoacyl-[acyl-carrier protein] reductase